MTRSYDNVRHDHKHWLCKNEDPAKPGKPCHELNDIEKWFCMKCQEHRTEGALAATEIGLIIGELEEVTLAAQEYWHYYPDGGKKVTVQDIVYPGDHIFNPRDYPRYDRQPWEDSTGH